jgi:serine/threonine-protein kinase ATR
MRALVDGLPLRVAGKSDCSSLPITSTFTWVFCVVFATWDTTVRLAIRGLDGYPQFCLDTLRTHVRGVLTRNPEWQSALAGFQVEGAWMVGAWEDVQDLVHRTTARTSSIVLARVLLAMRSKDAAAILSSLSVARSVLGTPITAAGAKGYRRSYEAVLDLHLTHELELIYNALTSLPVGSQGHSQLRQRTVTQLNTSLSARLDATLPTFRTREPVLSMRRTAFALM